MGAAAGKFRHRIAIDRRINAQNPTTGVITVTWENVHPSVPASIEPLSAREFIAASAGQSEITARITIRYLPGLDATHRIRHGNKIYNPAGWLPDRDSGLDYLTAPVSEGVNQG